MTRLPSGTSVWLPEDCAKLRQCEKDLRDLFLEAGAGEIATPTLEYVRDLERGFGFSKKIFKILDLESDGEILGLRPELTTSAAALFASSLSNRPLPLKLFYIGQVYRQEMRHRGLFREFRQAGFECYGGDLYEEDLNAIRLAVKALSKFDVKREAVIEIGHVGIVEALLAEEKITGAKRTEIKESIRKKSADRLPEKFQRLLKIDSEEAMFDSVRAMTRNPGVLTAIEEMERMANALRDLPCRIIFEIAATREIEYYTGIVFEGLLPKLGRPVFSGGRYDRLVEQFGTATPATGFSLELETLLRR